MFRKKVYGQSRVENCPFCGKRALTMNAQGVPCCPSHKERNLPEMKCACGEWLDLMKGKYGPFFICMRCGPVSFRKGMDINSDSFKKKTEEKSHSDNTNRPREMTVTSDEVDFL